MFARILGPSERGADRRSITYECPGTVVMHHCAPVARMSLLRVQTPPRPTPVVLEKASHPPPFANQFL